MDCIESVLQYGALSLKNAPKLLGLDIRPRLESEILLGHTLKQNRIYLHTHAKKTISAEKKTLFFAAILRRTQGEPIEYITNSVSFYGRDFYVDNRVLIPRPETEILIDVVSNFIIQNGITRIAEVGIGSGVISITLSLLHTNAYFLATDISNNALKVAAHNIATFKRQNAITLKCCNILECLDDMDSIALELIVSNPPYICANYPISAPLSYEPMNALFGGDDGLNVIRELIMVSKRLKITLICEIAHNQSHILQSLLHDAKAKNVVFYNDLSGIKRVFMAQW